MELRGRTHREQLGIVLSRVGCKTQRWPSGNADLRIQGRRVEYHRFNGHVIEWYENSQEGLEQGFTVDSRLQCPEGEGPVLEMEMQGSMRGVLWPGGEQIDLMDGSSEIRWSYGKIHVIDARWREFPAWITLEGDRTVAIHVQDTGAEYPITIDPLISLDTH